MKYNCFCNSHLIQSLHPLKGPGDGADGRSRQRRVNPTGQGGQRFEEQMTVLIKNGTVVDPASGLHEVRDLWIDGTRIAEPAGHADQVIDVTGRVVATENINGTCSKTVNVKAGVYVLRLVNGNDVKTQNIVIK